MFYRLWINYLFLLFLNLNSEKYNSFAHPRFLPTATIWKYNAFRFSPLISFQVSKILDLIYIHSQFSCVFVHFEIFKWFLSDSKGTLMHMCSHFQINAKCCKTHNDLSRFLYYFVRSAFDLEYFGFYFVHIYVCPPTRLMGNRPKIRM